jgi:hypothetical protein
MVSQQGFRSLTGCRRRNGSISRGPKSLTCLYCLSGQPSALLAMMIANIMGKNSRITKAKIQNAPPSGLLQRVSDCESLNEGEEEEGPPTRVEQALLLGTELIVSINLLNVVGHVTIKRKVASLTYTPLICKLWVPGEDAPGRLQ